MNEIFQYFADVLLVTMRIAGCSHPATGQIFKSKTWLFIGSRNFCRVQGIFFKTHAGVTHLANSSSF